MAADQDRHRQLAAALTRGPRRRVVLATNVAETSVTVTGVTAVVDTGLARRLESDPARGLDHGTWSPLLHMYPDAAIPVVQLSVQTARGAAHHLALGWALRPLAAQGVLIVGSGHMTHNLRDRAPGGESAAPLAYAQAFRDWIDARVQAGDLAALVGYRAQAPSARRAHPSEEHFLPLFVALGAAADDYRADRVYQGIESGALAMDSYCFGPA